MCYVGDGKQKKKVHAYMKSIAWFDRGSKFGEENTCMFVVHAIFLGGGLCSCLLLYALGDSYIFFIDSEVISLV